MAHVAESRSTAVPACVFQLGRTRVRVQAKIHPGGSLAVILAQVGSLRVRLANDEKWVSSWRNMGEMKWQTVTMVTTRQGSVGRARLEAAILLAKTSLVRHDHSFRVVDLEAGVNFFGILPCFA